jgi:arylsulfatase A-like enzyme
MDEQIGRLRAKLRELGIEKRTLVFFCSDNGPSDGLARKGVASAGPFKGHKHTMYEGGLLVPACVEWPGTIAAGGSTSVRCSTMDFFPTITALLDKGSSKQDSRPIDGIDLMPIIKGEITSRSKPLFFGYRRLHQGINGQALIADDWKLLREAKEDGPLRLFNLADDPYEQTDLAAEFPDRTEELCKQLMELDASCRRSRDGADYRY